MFLDFNKIFNPSAKEISRQKAKINEIIDENIKKYGNACSNCKNSRYIEIEDSVNHYYVTCKKDKKFMLSDDEERYTCCGKYERKIIE